MHTCKHTPLAYYACTYSTTTYSYLPSVERAYIAAQAEIVDILHKEQNQKINKKDVRKTTNHSKKTLIYMYTYTKCILSLS